MDETQDLKIRQCICSSNLMSAAVVLRSSTVSAVQMALFLACKILSHFCFKRFGLSDNEKLRHARLSHYISIFMKGQHITCKLYGVGATV